MTLWPVQVVESGGDDVVPQEKTGEDTAADELPAEEQTSDSTAVVEGWSRRVLLRQSLTSSRAVYLLASTLRNREKHSDDTLHFIPSMCCRLRLILIAGLWLR